MNFDPKNVSRETFSKLESYKSLLLKWQKAINLVSRETISDVENRHFHDSLQLIPYIPEDVHSHVDLGSGAGFPGLVLAIARPDLNSTLIESDLRKCEFLKNVSRETFSPVTILNQRIESISQDQKYDLITARALSDLNQLLTYAKPLSHEESLFLFLKGREAQKEIEDAQKNWEFDLEISPSLTHSEGQILVIRNLVSKGN